MFSLSLFSLGCNAAIGLRAGAASVAIFSTNCRLVFARRQLALIYTNTPRRPVSLQLQNVADVQLLCLWYMVQNFDKNRFSRIVSRFSLDPMSWRLLDPLALLIKDNLDVTEDMYKSISFKLCYKIFDFPVFLAQWCPLHHRWKKTTFSISLWQTFVTINITIITNIAITIAIISTYYYHLDHYCETQLVAKAGAGI